MKHLLKSKLILATTAALVTGAAADDLAKAAQNPLAAGYSLPIEATFDFGAANGEATFINIQPVIPVTVGDWNLVNRTIIPLIDSPGNLVGTSGISGQPIKGNGAFGLGDINPTTFFSPAKAAEVIWGIGPSFGLDTATNDQLGSGKWTMGPSAVVLTQPGPWALGILGQQLWTLGGDNDRQDVNRTLIQPFITYNLGDGWGITTDPIITANWTADDSSNRWVLPLGGGVRKMTKIGSQPVCFNLRAYYNVIKPDGAPNWSMVFTMQFLFPKS